MVYHHGRLTSMSLFVKVADLGAFDLPPQECCGCRPTIFGKAPASSRGADWGRVVKPVDARQSLTELRAETKLSRSCRHYWKEAGKPATRWRKESLEGARWEGCARGGYGSRLDLTSLAPPS